MSVTPPILDMQPLIDEVMSNQPRTTMEVCKARIKRGIKVHADNIMQAQNAIEKHEGKLKMLKDAVETCVSEEALVKLCNDYKL